MTDKKLRRLVMDLITELTEKDIIDNKFWAECVGKYQDD